jgi:hypothetical protein
LEVEQVASGDETVESPTVESAAVERHSSAITNVVERPGTLELPYGSAVTASGRISGVTEPGELSVHYPFPVKDLVILDDALKFGSRGAKARFAVYLGDLGSDTAATAREILASVPTPDNAVLLAVSPNQKAIEVVYGSEVQGRGIEEAAPLGVSAAAASFAEGNLLDGLISAIRVLSAAVSPH